VKIANVDASAKFKKDIAFYRVWVNGERRRKVRKEKKKLIGGG